MLRRAAALVMMLGTACSTDPSNTSDSGGPEGGGGGFGCLTCVDAQNDASLLQKVEGVLGSICGNPDGCHGGGQPPFSITGGDDFAPLINVPSTERPDMVRIKPGDPEHSYLYLKVACEGGIDGSCMPPGPPQPSLATLFYDWIEAGAPTQ